MMIVIQATQKAEGKGQRTEALTSLATSLTKRVARALPSSAFGTFSPRGGEKATQFSDAQAFSPRGFSSALCPLRSALCLLILLIPLACSKGDAKETRGAAGGPPGGRRNMEF